MNGVSKYFLSRIRCCLQKNESVGVPNVPNGNQRSANDSSAQDDSINNDSPLKAPPPSKGLTAAMEAKRKRLAAKEQREKETQNDPIEEVSSEPTQPPVSDSTPVETDYHLRRTEAAKKEQERIRQLEVEMRNKMQAARNELEHTPTATIEPIELVFDLLDFDTTNHDDLKAQVRKTLAVNGVTDHTAMPIMLTMGQHMPRTQGVSSEAASTVATLHPTLQADADVVTAAQAAITLAVQIIFTASSTTNATTIADGAADPNGRSDNRSALSPGVTSRYDENDDSSSTMDSTLIQQVHGLPVRSLTLQRTAGPLGFKLVQAPDGTVGVRFDQIIAMSQAENAGCQVNDVVVAVGETIVLRNNKSRPHVNIVRDAMLECGDVIQLHVVKGSEFDLLEAKANDQSTVLSPTQLQEDGDQEIRDNQNARLLAQRLLLDQSDLATEAAAKKTAEIEIIKQREAAEALRAQQAESESASLRQKIADAAEQQKKAALKQAAETMRAEKAETEAAVAVQNQIEETAALKKQMVLKEAAETLRVQKAEAEAAALKEQVALERAAALQAAGEVAQQQAAEIEAQAQLRIEKAEAEARILKEQMAQEKREQQERQAARDKQSHDAQFASKQAVDSELLKSRRETEEARKAAEQEIHENKVARRLAEKMLQDNNAEVQNKIGRIEAEAQQKILAAQRDAEVQKRQAGIQFREREETIARENAQIRAERQTNTNAEMMEMRAKVQRLASDNTELSNRLANNDSFISRHNPNQSFFAPENINASFAEPRNATTEELEDAKDQTRSLSIQIVQISERLAKEEQTVRELQMKYDDKDLHLRVKDSQLSDLNTRFKIIEADNNEMSQQLTKDRGSFDNTVKTVSKLTAENSRLLGDVEDAKMQSEELYQKVIMKDQLLRQQNAIAEKKGAQARAATSELQAALAKMEGVYDLCVFFFVILRCPALMTSVLCLRVFSFSFL